MCGFQVVGVDLETANKIKQKEIDFDLIVSYIVCTLDLCFQRSANVFI